MPSLRLVGCSFLLFVTAIAVLTMAAEGRAEGIALDCDTPNQAAEPGEKVTFEVSVTNEDNRSQTINLTLYSENVMWVRFIENGANHTNLTLNTSETRNLSLRVSLPLFNRDNIQIVKNMWKPYYRFSVNVTTDETVEILNLSVKILQVDLVLVNINIEDKYENNTPDIGDEINFTATVHNDGTKNVSDVRLYIFAGSRYAGEFNNGDDHRILQKNGLEYTEFDIDADETVEVLFRWVLIRGKTTKFEAQVNPSCSDARIVINCNSIINHQIDELGRYYDSNYIRSIKYSSGNYVSFYMLPNLKINNIINTPKEPVSGTETQFAITMENYGNIDWNFGEGKLKLNILKDNIIIQSVEITQSIGVGEEIIITFYWRAPEVYTDSIIKMKVVLDNEDIQENNFQTDEIDVEILVRAREPELMLGPISQIALLALIVASIFTVGFIVKRRFFSNYY